MELDAPDMFQDGLNHNNQLNMSQIILLLFSQGPYFFYFF